MRSSRTLPIGIGLVFALVGLVRYCGQQQRNPVTGEVQHVAMSPRQEVALGLHSARLMTQQYGGELRDVRIEPYVESVGQKLVQRSLAASSPYRFDFHVLRDPRTINAFALPGGQVFITVGLLRRMRNEAQLGGVLGHEIGHVIGRHGAQHLAKQQLGQSLVTAISVGSYDPDHPGSGRSAALLAQAANQMVNLRFGRDDELESDRYGFDIMRSAGYDPRGILELMRILEQAAGGGRQPEFLSTHPNPGNRLGRLKGMLDEAYPRGVPENLTTNADAYKQNILDIIAAAPDREVPDRKMIEQRAPY